MINTWNVVERNNSKIVWKDINETKFDEIKYIEKTTGTEPFYCTNTKSVVFVTSSPDVNIIKGNDYSELEMISRYLTTENKLYDLLKS